MRTTIRDTVAERKAQLAAPPGRRYLSGREIEGAGVRLRQVFRLRSSATSTRSPGPPTKLSSHLTEDRIKVPLDSRDKAGILEELCALLSRVAGVEDRAGEILEAVRRREAVLSTGVGGGIALPHGKCAALDRLEIVAGTTREPVDFESVDGSPVRLVVLMAGPPSAASHHVKTLAQISRTMRDQGLRDQLIAAPDAVRFLDLIEAAEA
jgi:PTS system nitrogen regulatory IIA component